LQSTMLPILNNRQPAVNKREQLKIDEGGFA